jgi:exodeoxyribonuclease VII large subunit
MIRGGGGADDLASFSAEPVVRAIAASRIPSIVAIGHERDVSLAELAADQRASTPSNAAELLVPDQKAEKSWLKVTKNQLDVAINSRYKLLRIEVDELKRALTAAFERTYSNNVDNLSLKAEMLRLLNPELPLQRGFALVRSEAGQIVRSRKQVNAGNRLNIAVSDGRIVARIE